MGKVLGKSNEEFTFVLQELTKLNRYRLSEEDRLEVVKFSVEQSIAALGAQMATLQSLRQRATNIIAINGAILLLARTIIPSTEIPPIQTGQTLQGWLLEHFYFSGAVLMFVAAVILSIVVLATRSGWLFTTSGKKFSDKYLNSGKYANLEGVFLDFLQIAERNHRSNDLKLRKMHWFLLFSICSTLLHGSMWLGQGVNG